MSAPESGCVPASSATSERVFSAGGQIVGCKKTKLQPDFVDKLLFVQQNHDQITIKKWILASKDIGVGDDEAEDEGRDVTILDTPSSVGSQGSLPGPSQSTSQHQRLSHIIN